MKQALSLARLALGQVSPNPAVGAVVVRGGEVVGQGYTQPPGSSHAEIAALEQAGEQARGSVMYVTLEPCSHYGRTPPCVEAIIDAGICEVHLAMLDPNPQVCGQGRGKLEEKGITTYVGEHEEEAEQVNEAYIKYIATGMPFVTAKFAVSLDGKIATRTGDSRWISSELARKRVHSLRYITDAIMAGVNTVLHDDPELTARSCGGKGGVVKAHPLRVIVDSNGRTPLSAKVLTAPGKTMLAMAREVSPDEEKAFAAADAELLDLPSAEGRVDLEKLLKALGDKEITSVLVEGGGSLLGSLFDNRLVDKVVAFVAPIIIGGEDAKTAVAGRGVEKVSDALRLEKVTMERLGDDMLLSGYVSAQPSQNRDIQG